MTRKLSKRAKELLHAAHKVYHYRRDVLHQGRLAELQSAVGEVDRLMAGKNGAGDAELDAALDRLDALLARIGGKIHPKTFLSDNLEVLLVAAILVIGIRTFFFQPFIIPTNSMYPTYSGMNAVVYQADESPGPVARVFHKLLKGASHYNLTAPTAGDVRVPFFSQAPNSVDANLRRLGIARFKPVKGRKWFGLLPADKREYTFYVGAEPVALRVPLDFNLDPIIAETFFPEADSLMDVAAKGHRGGRVLLGGTNPILETGRRLEAGDPVVRFDITLGDALFVDRFTYHFRRPKAGEPFVFRTRDIPGIEGGPDSYVDKYYIKRLAGVPGERLEIRDGALLADGEPRDEVEAFERNARREGEYSGYVNQNLLDAGRQLTVPDDRFVALGDNSPNSLDSRYWGFVPEEAVIGKAIFIYYPFTRRWGPAE